MTYLIFYSNKTLSYKLLLCYSAMQPDSAINTTEKQYLKLWSDEKKGKVYCIKFAHGPFFSTLQKH
jgi:hypothetical protein